MARLAPSCAGVCPVRTIDDNPASDHPTPKTPLPVPLEYSKLNSGAKPRVPGGSSRGIEYPVHPLASTENVASRVPKYISGPGVGTATSTRNLDLDEKSRVLKAGSRT